MFFHLVTPSQGHPHPGDRHLLWHCLQRLPSGRAPRMLHRTRLAGPEVQSMFP